jgi:hypothetical protein
MKTIFLAGLFASISYGMAAPEVISDPEAHSTFAILNQKWLNEFEKKNPNLFLYSLTPEEQTEPHTRSFKAVFFTSDSRRLTETIDYIQANGSWRLHPSIIIDSKKAEQGAAANP